MSVLPIVPNEVNSLKSYGQSVVKLGTELAWHWAQTTSKVLATFSQILSSCVCAIFPLQYTGNSKHQYPARPQTHWFCWSKYIMLFSSKFELSFLRDRKRTREFIESDFSERWVLPNMYFVYTVIPGLLLWICPSERWVSSSHFKQFSLLHMKAVFTPPCCVLFIPHS